MDQRLLAGGLQTIRRISNRTHYPDTGIVNQLLWQLDSSSRLPRIQRCSEARSGPKILAHTRTLGLL